MVVQTQSARENNKNSHDFRNNIIFSCLPCYIFPLTMAIPPDINAIFDIDEEVNECDMMVLVMHGKHQ